MPRTIPLLAAALLLVAQPLAAQSLESRPLLDTLSIEAEGIYEAEPDLAVLSFSVFSQEKELKRAYEKVSASVQAILDLAKRNNIAGADVTVGAFIVQPLYDSKQRARSYPVATRVTLKLRDLTRAGTILDEVVQQGLAEFRSLDYTLEDREDANRKAVEQAMQRATDRARAALGQSGRKLGSLRLASIDLKGVIVPLKFESREVFGLAALESGAAMARSEAVASTPVPPVAAERIRVRATVKCLFQIE